MTNLNPEIVRVFTPNREIGEPEVVQIFVPGLQGAQGIQGIQGETPSTASFLQNSITSSIVFNSSTSSFAIKTEITGAFTTLSSSFISDYPRNEFTNSFLQNSLTSSLVFNSATSSFLMASVTSSLVFLNTTSSMFVSSSIVAETASYSPNYLPLSGGTITGDVFVTGVATVAVLKTLYTTSSIIYQSGSTKFGDSSDDKHEITGSFLVNGTASAEGGFHLSGIGGNITTNADNYQNSSIGRIGYYDFRYGAFNSGGTVVGWHTNLSKNGVTTQGGVPLYIWNQSSPAREIIFGGSGSTEAFRISNTGQLNVTASANFSSSVILNNTLLISESILRVFSPSTQSKYGRIYSDTSYFNLGGNLVTPHIQMALESNVTYFGQKCIFSSGVQINGSPWTGAVLILDKGYYPQDDYLRWGNEGKIDVSGAFGIGTPNPSYKVHIDMSGSQQYLSGSLNVDNVLKVSGSLVSVTGSVNLFAPYSGSTTNRYLLHIQDQNLAYPNSTSALTFGTQTDAINNGNTVGIRAVWLGNNFYEGGLSFHSSTGGNGIASNQTEVFRITNYKNLLVGGIIDVSSSLAVYGKTSGTSSFVSKFLNSSNNNIQSIRDDGKVEITGSLNVTGSINSIGKLSFSTSTTATYIPTLLANSYANIILQGHSQVFSGLGNSLDGATGLATTDIYGLGTGGGYFGGIRMFVSNNSSTLIQALTINKNGSAFFSGSITGSNLLINASGGFTGGLLDLQVNGSSFLSVLGSGTIIRNNASAYRNNTINGSFYFDAGTIVIRDGNSGDTNVKLAFGSLTGTAHPMIKRNGAGLDVRLADNSDFADFSAGQTTISSSLTISGSLQFQIPTSNGTYNGNIAKIYTIGENVSFGDLLYIDSNGTWKKTNSNSSESYSRFLGIALETSTTGNSIFTALPNSFISSNGFSFNPGMQVFLGTSSGSMSSSAPTTSTHGVRVIGMAIDATTLFFNPSSDYLTLV